MASTKTMMFSLIILSGICCVLASSPGTHDLYEVNICKEEQKFHCKNGELISLKSLVCASGSQCSQNVNRTLFDLCQGQHTCSNLGIVEMLPSQCKNVKNTFLVRFTCLPGSNPTCRSNICADSSEGLTCPTGSVVHIRGMTCGSVTGKCSVSTYTNMYVCEGVDRCASSGLKTLLPQNCQHEVPWKRNVIVQYICVLERLIDNTCMSGKTLDNDFGILRSPDRDAHSVHTRTSCKWRINPTGLKKVKVIVHQINSQITQAGCDHRLLSIDTVDCNNGSAVTRSFCNVGSSSVELMSCGQVLVRSTIPPGQKLADAFVVSYQSYSSNVSSNIPSGLPSCLAPPDINLPDTLSQLTTEPSSKTSPRPSPKSLSVGRNYGPGDGMFEYRDSLYEEDTSGNDSVEDSNTVPKQLRLMVLYIFFGVVILVLVVALIAVIVSYRRISKFKGHRVDSSEKTALCQHYEDTRLDTFISHNMAESSGTLISETACAFTADHEPDQVVATVHHDAVSEQSDSEPQFACGNSVSTFLAGKRDSDVRGLATDFQTCSFAPAACLESASNNDQESDHYNIGGGGYFEFENTCHYDLPGDCEGNIYEVMDLGNITSTRSDKENNHSHALRPADKHLEDKLYEVTNHDPSVVGLQHSPIKNQHYHINNDEYAVIIKTPKLAKSPHVVTPKEDQQRLSNQSGPNDFHPTVGPHDQQRKPTAGVNARWSKEDRGEWTDEL